MEIYVDLTTGEETEIVVDPIFETQNDSYHDEYGLVKFPSYVACMHFEFDEGMYNEADVATIRQYIYDNFEWMAAHEEKYYKD